MSSIKPSATNAPRGIISKILDNPLSVFALAVSATSALLGFLFWITLSVKAIVFHIPISEVPNPASINGLIFLIALACLILIVNYWMYQRLIKVSGSFSTFLELCKITLELIFLFGASGIIAWYLIFISVGNLDLSNLPGFSSLSSPVAIVSLLYFFGGIGIQTAILQKGVSCILSFCSTKRKASTTERSNPDEKTRNRNRFIEVIDEPLPISIGVCSLFAFLLVFALLHGFLLALKTGVSAIVRVPEDNTIFAVIFSTDRSYCLQKCIIDDNEQFILVDTSKYEWALKDGIEAAEPPAYSIRPTMLFPEFSERFVSNGDDAAAECIA